MLGNVNAHQGVGKANTEIMTQINRLNGIVIAANMNLQIRIIDIEIILLRFMTF